MEVKKYSPFVVIKPKPKTTVPPASEARSLNPSPRLGQMLRLSLKLRVYL